MDIILEQNGTELTIRLKGRLDNSTSPQLSETVASSLSGITSLIFDFTDLAYVSSAGLRVLLTAQKTMKKQGKMVVRHPNEDVIDIFEITGFNNILTIEK
ncbi:MAG: STAS domain-containing protein [Bacilli bacterium]|nr:STAS domain-containing protein [Bacilli bacterium]